MLKTESPKAVNDLIVGKQCFFCINRGWVFDYSISENPMAWSVINQVYFRNSRQHKTLSFALPYVVAELSLSSIFSDAGYVRIVIAYGDSLSSMMGSINHLMAREAGTTLHIDKLSEPCQLAMLQKIFNKTLKANYEFNQVKFHCYEEGFHRTLSGSWHELPLNSDNITPQLFRN